MIEVSLNPQSYPWYTINKALLLLHTIVLYGSEKAVDMCIQLYRVIEKLQNYNSVTFSMSSYIFGGGTDYGQPVRNLAKQLASILVKDENIRDSRAAAREGSDCLVPIGETSNSNTPSVPQLSFGQAVESRVGAGYGLEAIPGMYEGRPDRYFDSLSDPRATKPTGDHQFTREVQ